VRILLPEHHGRRGKYPWHAVGKLVLTAVFIASLNCPSCANLVHTTLTSLIRRPNTVSVSILCSRASILHPASLETRLIEDALYNIRLDINSIVTVEPREPSHFWRASHRCPEVLRFSKNPIQTRQKSWRYSLPGIGSKLQFNPHNGILQNVHQTDEDKDAQENPLATVCRV
jgi:hypothetical protein